MSVPAVRSPRYVASSKTCCRHISWLSCSGIESDALARLLIAVSEATIEATSPGASTCPVGDGTAAVVLPPWVVRSLGCDVVLVEVVLAADLDTAGLEQAARSSARAARTAPTPLSSARPEELRRELDMSLMTVPVHPRPNPSSLRR